MVFRILKSVLVVGVEICPISVRIMITYIIIYPRGTPYVQTTVRHMGVVFEHYITLREYVTLGGRIIDGPSPTVFPS